MASKYLLVKDLPASLRHVLQALEYHRKDIELVVKEKVSLYSSGMGDGYQGFTCLVNLETGHYQIERGSWGGANPFNNSPVDHDQTEMILPNNVVAILGQRGSSVYARIVANPHTINPLLPGNNETLTSHEQEILGIYKSYKAAYRKEYLARMGATQKEIDSLIDRGYLSRNKGGAVSLTTLGKNNAK